MELSCLPSPTARILHGRTIPIPTKITCISKRRFQYQIPPLSTNPNCSNLFYQPNNSFLKTACVISYGRKRIPLLKATADQKEKDTSDSLITKALKFPYVLLRFMLPHIVIAETVALTAIMTRTWIENAHLLTLPKWILLLRAIVLLIGVLCPTGFTNGINQIHDIEIDKINKPHYPLVSGELSLQLAWILVISFAVIGIVIPVLLKSGSLLVFVFLHMVLGILYSVPPFSIKKSTVGAILTCALAQFAFVTSSSVAARTISGLPLQFSAPIIFLAIFATVFTMVCASLKDIHDLEGDKKFNVPTLASIYGSRKVSLFSFGLLLFNYVGAIVTAVLLPQVFRQNIMIPAHVVLSSLLVFQAWKLEKANYTKEVSQSVYQSVWKLLGAEFFLFLFI